MKKQTAVDWLIQRLNKLGFAQVVTDEEIKQAKQIEKEQMYDAYDEGYLYFSPHENFNEYYNETYVDK
jgi:hypothetical protein